MGEEAIRVEEIHNSLTGKGKLFSKGSFVLAEGERFNEFSVLLDSACRIVYGNDSELLAHERGQIPGKLLHCRKGTECVEMNPCEECHVRNAFTAGSRTGKEIHVPGVGRVESIASPYFDADGNVALVAVTIRKIDSEGSSEEPLKKANQMLEAVIRASPLPIIALDNSAKVILWNPAAEKTFGYTAREIIGCQYPLVPKPLASGSAGIMDVQSNGFIIKGKEFLRKKKSSELIPVRSYTAPLYDESGSVIGTLGILEDLSESKRAEVALKEAHQKLQAIINASPLPIVAIDTCGNVTIWNPAAERVFGWTTEEVLGRKYPCIPKGGMKKFNRHLRRFNKGEVFTGLEMQQKRKDGKVIPVCLFSAVLRDQEDNIVGSMGVLPDLSDARRTEEEKKKMEAKLLQANRMTSIGILAAGIAHEINNPNTFILSNAQFLADVWPNVIKVLSEYSADHGEVCLGKIPLSEAGVLFPKVLDGLIEGANRIKNIVNGLKDFARDEKPHSDRMTDLNEVVRAAMTILQNQVAKYTVNFRCSLSKKLPLVKGSFQQLEQVVINLTMNALQALPDRTSGVFISTRYCDSEGLVVLKIRDEGIGMRKDVQNKIFDPFFSTKLNSGGTGLGLSICYTIIQDHGGSIECDSRFGRGSTFQVSLPVSELVASP